MHGLCVLLAAAPCGCVRPLTSVLKHPSALMMPRDEVLVAARPDFERNFDIHETEKQASLQLGYERISSLPARSWTPPGANAFHVSRSATGMGP
eukprot:220948-Prymnesium_polylepis.1